MTRPQRHRKADLVMHPGSSATDIRHDYACAAFDRAARAADAEWGQDRLPELVSPATAEKYGSAMAKLNAAISGDDPAETATRAAVCIRGMDALRAEAIALGHRPTPPEAWRFTMEDGQACAVIREGGDWTALAASLPGVRLYSLREVMLALQHYGASVAAIKDTFPASEVVAVRKLTKLEKDLNDIIPF